MCDVCGSTPCNSRCPYSADWEKEFTKCYFCGNSIYEGETYYCIGDRNYCDDCINECQKIAGEE